MRERAHHRRGDDVQRLDLVVGRGRAPRPARPTVWTSSATSTSRSRDGSKRLTHRLAEAGARAGVDPADRVARRVRPDAGEPRRILGEARCGRGRGRPSGRSARAPVVGIVRGQTRNVSVSSRSSIAAATSERVADRELHRAQGVTTPRRSALTWNRRTTRSYGRERPRVAQHRRPRLPPSTRSRSRTSTPGLVSSSARSQARGSRRWFQTSIVERDLVAERHRAGRRARGGNGRRVRPLRAHAAWTTSSSSASDAEEDRDRDAEQAPEQEQDERREDARRPSIRPRRR